MKTTLFFALVCCSFDLFAESIDKNVNVLFKTQISSIEKNDYKEFVSKGSDSFKKGITQENFNNVEKQVLSKFKSGHEEIYLTTLKQGEYLTYLWKITFKDKSDDLTARMSLDKDGKVSGFWLLP